MEIKEIKEYIYENNLIIPILEDIGMHSIREHGGNYITCAFPDGDNTNGCVVYINEMFNVTGYTRNIIDPYGCSDIISLVAFVKDIYWSNAVKYLCDYCGFDYYKETNKEIPLSMIFMKRLASLRGASNYDEDGVKPIPEHILNYYYEMPSYKWYEDGIDYETQQLFRVGFDPLSRRITIPVYDELGTLVGVKGRIYDDADSNNKYMYIMKCPKEKLLFGLDKAYQYIKDAGCVYVVESEKSVMKMFSYGYKNTVSIGGHSLSRTQIEKLTRLNCKIIICFDKDVPEMQTQANEICVLGECYKFLPIVQVEYMLDKDSILDKKESPCDRKDKFEYMNKNNRYIYVR